MKVNNKQDIGVYLESIRGEKGKTLDDVSLRSSTVSDIENGKTNVKIDTLFKLLNELGVEMHLQEKPDINKATYSTSW